MTEDTVLDTTIHEPSMTAGEEAMLLFALERARAQFAWKCGGLDAAGLRRPHPPSTMTLGGLLKHLALIEDSRSAVFLTGAPIGGRRGTRSTSRPTPIGSGGRRPTTPPRSSTRSGGVRWSAPGP